MLRIKNKTEEIKNDISMLKIEIKNIIYSFFEQLLYRLTIKEIKEDEQHLEIFKELKKIRKFGLFPSKDLYDLVEKVLDERGEELIKYRMKMENKKFEEDNSEKNRSCSIDLSIQRNNFKKLNTSFYKNIKYKNNIRKPKKNNLIYNNLYLYKDNESDDENKHNLIIKKEIKDILNTDFGENPKIIKNTSILFSRRRKTEKYNNQRQFLKKKAKTNRTFLKLNDEILDEKLLLKNKLKNKELEEKLKIEEKRDKKIYQFFAKIQKLKKIISTANINNDDDEINLFIDKQIDNNDEMPKDKLVGRLNFFLKELNLNRIRIKCNKKLKNKNLGFLSPIIFTSPSETSFNLSNNKNK